MENIKMQKLISGLGGSQNFIHCRFGDWRDRTFIIHLFDISKIDFVNVVNAGVKIQILKSGKVIIRLARYQEWKEFKNLVKNIFYKLVIKPQKSDII